MPSTLCQLSITGQKDSDIHASCGQLSQIAQHLFLPDCNQGHSSLFPLQNREAFTLRGPLERLAGRDRIAMLCSLEHSVVGEVVAVGIGDFPVARSEGTICPV